MRPATDDTHVYKFNQETGDYALFKITKVGRNLVSALRMITEDWEPLYRDGIQWHIRIYAHVAKCISCQGFAFR